MGVSPSPPLSAEIAETISALQIEELSVHERQLTRLVFYSKILAGRADHPVAHLHHRVLLPLDLPDGDGQDFPVYPVFITAGLPKFVADWLAVLAVMVLCFLVGTLVATWLGSWLWQQWEENVMTRLPGYTTVREVIAQLMGNSSDSPFSRGEVARVWLYGRNVDVSVTALVTSRHADGHVTVFVPTGPNPTSGFIYHVDETLVELHPEIGVESMMKTVAPAAPAPHRCSRQTPEQPVTCSALKSLQESMLAWKTGRQRS